MNNNILEKPDVFPDKGLPNNQAQDVTNYLETDRQSYCKHEVCSVIRNERSFTTPNSTPEPRSLFGPRSPSSRRAGARVPPYTPPPLGYRGNPINRTLNIVISVTVALPVSKSDWGASLSHSPAKLRIDLYRTIFHL